MTIVPIILPCLRLCFKEQVMRFGKYGINCTVYPSVSFYRNFSVQPPIESAVKSQSGVFQSISESIPVDYVQKFLISVHDVCGLPWWANIVMTTIVLRSCITVPFAIYQQNIIAKLENINREMPAIAKELKKETYLAIKLYNWDERTAQYHYKKSLKKQWNKLIIRDNCHPFKTSVLLWVQIPLWVSYSMSLRNMVYLLPKGDMTAHIVYTQLSIGGFGWIINLTDIDSTYILPFMLGLINLTNIELNTMSKVGRSIKLQNYITNFFRIVSIFIIPIAASVPSCLTLYWTTSSAYGLMQNLILMSPRVKRFCGIPQTQSEIKNPYQHVINNIKHKYVSYLKLK